MLPVRPQNERVTEIAADGSRKLPVTAGVLLHLVSIGIISVATVVLFGVASMSLLDTGATPITASRIDDRVLSRTAPNIGPITTQKASPAPESEEMRPAFTPQGASADETSRLAGTNASSERLSSDRDVRNALETPTIVRIPDLLTVPTHSTEINEAEAPVAALLPVSEASVILDGARSTPPEERYKTPPEVEKAQNRPIKPRQGSVASDEEASAQSEQNRSFHRRAVSAKADFRNRVQKECGSIIFPALRRHCVASFGIYYR